METERRSLVIERPRFDVRFWPGIVHGVDRGILASYTVAVPLALREAAAALEKGDPSAAAMEPIRYIVGSALARLAAAEGRSEDAREIYNVYVRGFEEITALYPEPALHALSDAAAHVYTGLRRAGHRVDVNSDDPVSDALESLPPGERRRAAASLAAVAPEEGPAITFSGRVEGRRLNEPFTGSIYTIHLNGLTIASQYLRYLRNSVGAAEAVNAYTKPYISTIGEAEVNAEPIMEMLETALMTCMLVSTRACIVVMRRDGFDAVVRPTRKMYELKHLATGAVLRL